MNSTHHPRALRATGLAVVLVALVVAACSSAESAEPAATTSPPAAETTTTRVTTTSTAPSTTTTASATLVADDEDDDDPDAGHAAPAGVTEHEEPALRLVVADAGTGIIEFLDLTSGEAIAELDLEAPGRISAAGDGRHVLLGQGDEDRVVVVDGGAWEVEHGDHSHFYSAAPEIVAELAGPAPAHLVSHDGIAALFFDGRGDATILDVGRLDDGVVTVGSPVVTPAPHHGAVVPFRGHFAVTVPASDPEDLPVGVNIVHDDGEVEAEFPDCPDLHGETGGEATLAFACADGILAVGGDEGEWEAAKIDHPEGLEARVWTLAADDDMAWVAGALSQTGEPYGPEPGILVADLAAGGASVIDMPAPVYGVWAGGTGSLIALTVDGAVHLVDPVTGAVEVSAPVVEPFEVDYSGPLPSVVVSGSRAYVGDPAAGTVVEVALNDGLRIARTFDTDVTPGSMTVVGT